MGTRPGVPTEGHSVGTSDLVPIGLIRLYAPKDKTKTWRLCAFIKILYRNDYC